VASFGSQEPTDVNVYVNWARVGLGPFDLTLDLGYRTDDAPPEEFPVRAVMTWEQAKSLSSLLDDAITQYEAEVGEIRDFGFEIGPARPVGELEAPDESDEESKDA
jgi:hypothetical protein